MIGVLILVHQQIAELLLIIPADILVLLQQLHGQADDVVKVQGVVLPQLCLVLFISTRNILCFQVAGLLGLRPHLPGGNLLVLFLADGGKDILGREGFLVHVQILQDVLHHPLRVGAVIDGKASGIATQHIDVPAENPAAGRVEGHCPDVLGFAAQKGTEPILHLVGGLVGKGDGDDVPGGGRLQSAQLIGSLRFLLGGRFAQPLQKQHIAFLHLAGNLPAVAAPTIAHEVCNAVNQHGGLAASGTGQQQQRPLRGKHGLLLHLVELRKPCGNILSSGGNESGFHLFGHRYT